MFRQIASKKAQANVAEYLLVFFLVLGVVSAVTILFKRTIQARVYDANKYVFEQVNARTGGDWVGNLYTSYEPYYTNTISTSYRSSDVVTRLTAGMSSGVFNKTIDDYSETQSFSVQAPPKDSD